MYLRVKVRAGLKTNPNPNPNPLRVTVLAEDLHLFLFNVTFRDKLAQPQDF